jgi:hypothetical protein
MAPDCPYCSGATVGGCPRCEAITNNLPTGASVETAMPRVTIQFGTGEMTPLRTIDLGVRRPGRREDLQNHHRSERRH